MNSSQSSLGTDTVRQETRWVNNQDSANNVEESLELTNGPLALVDDLERLKEELQLKQQRILELERENQELKNQKHTAPLYREQEHQVSILAKQQEIKGLRKKLSEHEQQNAYLNQRIAVLENQILNQNIELQNKHTLTLNYDAVLKRLSRREAECKAVVEQRDELHQEISHATEQATQMTRQNDQLLERLTELNQQLVLLRNHYEEKIVEEQKNTTFWQHKYECEIQQCCHGYQNQTQDIHEEESMYHDHQPRISCETLDPGTIVEGLITADVSNNSENQSKPLESRDISSPPSKKRFEVGRSSLPQCKNCSAIFGAMRPLDSRCRFHLSPPQPYKTWKMFKEDAPIPQDWKRHFYWPCCEKIGIQEPPGCRMLRHHDIIFPYEGEE